MTFLRILLTCFSFAWTSTPLANPAELAPGSKAMTGKLVLPVSTDWHKSGPGANAVTSLRRKPRSDSRASAPVPMRTAVNPDRLIRSVRMLDTGEQAFNAVAVNLPVNFLIGETEVRVGLGWIGAQNNKPAGDITQGSAPQYAEPRFVQSTRNSVVFLFSIPF